MNFDKKRSVTKNSFVRNSEAMLNGIFGTTDVTPFWVADMDFPVANPIKTTAIAMIENDGSVESIATPLAAKIIAPAKPSFKLIRSAAMPNNNLPINPVPASTNIS